MQRKYSEWKQRKWIYVVPLIIVLACAQKQKKEGILAIVGDRIITTEEFIRRAEYTIRPPYCKRDSNIDKKIILNSLIAEKLYAFEAGKDNPLTRSKLFQAYIRGRKEQFMRHVLFSQIVKKKLKPNVSELKKRFQLAGREYRVAYCVFNKDIAQFAEEEKKKSPQGDLFDAVYRKSGGLGPPSERVVSWKSPELRAIRRALFSEPLDQGQVLGPIQVDSDQFLLLKVLGWIDRPAVTTLESQRRYEEVYEDWEREKAEEIWDQYVLKLMKNKRLEFHRETFEEMAELFRPLYIRSHPITISFMNPGKGQEIHSAVDSLSRELKKREFENRPFFVFDGKTWTVAEFMRLYASHPLVFRKKKFRQNEFPEQFKLGVADLMRDHVLNQEAYKRKIDESPAVQAYTFMWQDALVANFHLYNYLKTKRSGVETEKNVAKKIDRYIDLYLNSYSDSLFKKYSSKIQINVSEFERVKLTRIDMVALHENVPYREVVPPFPLVTKKYMLDYGKKME